MPLIFLNDDYLLAKLGEVQMNLIFDIFNESYLLHVHILTRKETKIASLTE